MCQLPPVTATHLQNTNAEGARHHGHPRLLAHVLLLCPSSRGRRIPGTTTTAPIPCWATAPLPPCRMPYNRQVGFFRPLSAWPRVERCTRSSQVPYSITCRSALASLARPCHGGWALGTCACRKQHGRSRRQMEERATGAVRRCKRVTLTMIFAHAGQTLTCKGCPAHCTAALPTHGASASRYRYLKVCAEDKQSC